MQNLNQITRNFAPKKDAKALFRKANKLMKRYIDSQTNPIGIPEYADVQWNNFLDKLSPELSDYFEATADKAVHNALEAYHRPIVRGTDGRLYSQSDMDDAMMGHNAHWNQNN